MEQIPYGVREIVELMEAFYKNKLGGLSITSGDFILKFKGESTKLMFPSAEKNEPSNLKTDIKTADVYSSIIDEISGKKVVSPIVGTFYSSPAPDKESYVTIGSKVKKGDILFVIESMKLMNEVVSQYDGVIKEVLVENSHAVEYGQIIMVIK